MKIFQKCIVYLWINNTIFSSFCNLFLFHGTCSIIKTKSSSNIRLKHFLGCLLLGGWVIWNLIFTRQYRSLFSPVPVVVRVKRELKWIKMSLGSAIYTLIYTRNKKVSHFTLNINQSMLDTLGRTFYIHIGTNNPQQNYSSILQGMPSHLRRPSLGDCHSPVGVKQKDLQPRN